MCGRGWAVLEDHATLRGSFFIHQGDEMSFEAVKVAGRVGRRPSPKAWRVKRLANPIRKPADEQGR